jgi:drug/metabolite transporter (DMT)-like permease
MNPAALLLVTAVLLWAGNFVAGRIMGESVSAVGLNVWRWSLAFAILVPLTLPEARRCWREIAHAWRFLLVLGLTGVAGFHILVYKALEYTSATNALLVISTSPAVIMLLSRVFLAEPIQPRQWWGILISFVGAVIIITRGDPEALRALAFGKGELWMLLAVPTWAAYNVLLKRRPPSLPQRSMLTGSTAFGLLWMAPLVVLWPGLLSVDWTPSLAGGVAYIGLGASVIAFLCWNRGVAAVGPSRAGVFIHLTPLFGAALEFLLLEQGLEPYHGVGAIFVLTGIVLTQPRRAAT